MSKQIFIRKNKFLFPNTICSKVRRVLYFFLNIVNFSCLAWFGHPTYKFLATSLPMSLIAKVLFNLHFREYKYNLLHPSQTTLSIAIVCIGKTKFQFSQLIINKVFE